MEDAERGQDPGGEVEEGLAPVAEVEAARRGADLGVGPVLLVAQHEDAVDGHAEPQRARLEPAGADRRLRCDAHARIQAARPIADRRAFRLYRINSFDYMLEENACWKDPPNLR